MTDDNLRNGESEENYRIQENELLNLCFIFCRAWLLKLGETVKKCHKMEDEQQTSSMLDEFRLHAFTAAAVISVAVVLIIRFFTRKLFDNREFVN